MPRHMSVDHHAYLGRVLGLQSWIALLAASLVTIVGAGFLLVPQQSLAKLPGPFGQACESEPVDIVVSPELLSVVTRLVRPLQGQTLADNHCLVPSVRSQEPQETVASADILPLSRAPQVWIPDATVWGEKVPRWPMSSLGSLASTPVVVATSVEAAKDLGWATKNPTWFQALRGGRPVIVPDYQSQSESLAVLIALWQSLGQGENAVEQVAATVLDADRSELPDPTEAVSDARSGSSNAPLFPATEQAVAYLNATSTIPRLTAVYPREGSPILDYPIFRREGIDQSPAQRGGVAAVIDRLRSAASLEVLRQSGFRRPAGEPGSRTVSVGTPVGTGIRWSEDVTVLNPPRRPEVDAMIDRVDSLAKPSRILTVMDVSLSMRAQLQDGVSRIQLAGAAARLGANLLPDSGSVGLWVFAARMDGDKDYRVIERVKPLDSRSGGESHRNRLIRLASTIESHLSGGGTALYDTTIAAFRNMHANYDPKAVNVIILLSDGGNSDLTGATLDDMLAEIRKLNTARRHVAIFTAGLGADADYAALRKISNISGGHTYRIDTALSGQRALLDGVRRTHKLKD
jgi:Ca-activated chloride channel family protein